MLNTVTNAMYVTFCTTNSTPSPSPSKMLHRCTVDHHITSHMPPLPIQVLQHFTTCENILTLSSALHKSMDSINIYSVSHSMAMHGAHTICSFYFAICLFILPYTLLIIPCVTSKFFHMLIALHYLYVSAFPYINIKYLSCICSFEYQLSSPLLSHFASEVNSLMSILRLSE